MSASFGLLVDLFNSDDANGLYSRASLKQGLGKFVWYFEPRHDNAYKSHFEELMQLEDCLRRYPAKQIIR